MVAASLADKPRLLALVLNEAGRRARHALRTGPLGGWRLAGAAPDLIPAVAGTLREGDPGIAADIYAGRFRFDGCLVDTGGRSPFQIVPPSQGWSAELRSFEWLRHLASAGDALASANARILVSDWIRNPGASDRSPSHDASAASRRLLAWLVHAELLIGDGAEAGFRRRFLRSLSQQHRFLRQAAPEAADGLPRLRVRIALAYAALCLRAGPVQVRLAARHLADELDRQIFADGVHVSRNPAASVTILADLLPLVRLFDGENQAVPKSLVTALDRMLPMLRFFRHADGGLALFNGAGAVDARLVTALMRHDETLGEPISHARQGGYQRLSAEGTVLLADTGLPPPAALSGEAHAGTLAFEFSAGGQRFVVNNGAPPRSAPEMRRLARTTAAHSTLVLADHSSSRFETAGAIQRFLGMPLLAGPSRVPAVFEEEGDGMRIAAAHDGYAARFGLVHERTVFLSCDGALIEGVDRLRGTPRGLASGEGGAATIRFHLHPALVAERMADGFRLLARGGECWSFHADQPSTIEESLFFADPSGPKRSRQIVLSFDPLTTRDIAWSFMRRRRACPTADAMMRQPCSG